MSHRQACAVRSIGWRSPLAVSEDRNPFTGDATVGYIPARRSPLAVSEDRNS